MDKKAEKPFSFMGYTHATPQEVRKVHEHSGLSIFQASSIAGVSADSYKGWLADVDSPRYRKPMRPTWLHFIYQLEAIRLGYEGGLEQLIKAAASQPVKLRKDRLVKTLQLLEKNPIRPQDFLENTGNAMAWATSDCGDFSYTLIGYIAELWRTNAPQYEMPDWTLEITGSSEQGAFLRYSPSLYGFGMRSGPIELAQLFFGISEEQAKYLFDNRDYAEANKSFKLQVKRLKDFIDSN